MGRVHRGERVRDQAQPGVAVEQAGVGADDGGGQDRDDQHHHRLVVGAQPLQPGDADQAAEPATDQGGERDRRRDRQPRADDVLLEPAHGGRGAEREHGIEVGARRDQDDVGEVDDARHAELKVQPPGREQVGAQVHEHDHDVVGSGADGVDPPSPQPASRRALAVPAASRPRGRISSMRMSRPNAYTSW